MKCYDPPPPMMRRPPGAAGAVAAACVTLTVLPAIVNTAVRLDVVVFAAAVYEADPVALPDPDTESHEALLEDVHEQPELVVTVTEPFAPAPPMDNDVLLTVYVQLLPA